MLNNILTIIKRDIKLAFKQGSSSLNLVLFFVIIVVLFAFAIGSESDLLQLVGASVIWVCALLSSLLAIPYIFEQDYEDGSLAQIYLQGDILESTVIAKIISHWLISLMPLIIISPLVTSLFHIEESMYNIAISLMIGTPAICAIGAMGSALTLGIKNDTILTAIIILPLYIPILIFGITATNGNISILIGLLLLILPVCIFAASAAIKIALEE